MYAALLAGCAIGAADTATVVPDACPSASVDVVAGWEEEALSLPSTTASGWPGAAIGDVDGDGLPDVVGAFGGGSTLFRNGGAAGFAQEPLWIDGVEGVPARAVSLADLDGDGDLDAFLGREIGETSLVLENDGTGRFNSVDLPDFTHRSWTGAFGDFDGDLDLDLYVATYDIAMNLEEIITGSQSGAGHSVFLQGPTGEWVRNAAALPPGIDAAASLHGAPLDADSDGDLDIYMANDFGPYLVPNQLLLNDGAGHFSVASSCYCDLSSYAMGAGVGDANGDGTPDIFSTDIGSPHLLVNDGHAQFVDATVSSGAYIPPSETHLASWGAAFVDINGDGCQDIAVSYGSLPESLVLGDLAATEDEWVNGADQQSALLLGDCAGGFERADDVFSDVGRGRGLAVGDLDRDGRADLVTFGKNFLRIFQTTGGCDPGISVRLSGPVGNREGIGARIAAVVDGQTHTLWMLPSVTAGSSLSEVYVGLGHATEAEITVHWPDGEVTEVGTVPLGSQIVVEQ